MTAPPSERLIVPMVLLDVDGVLNPARSRASGYRRHWVFPAGLAHRLLLNPRHGPMLAELAASAGAELVWATYWRDRANTWVGPRIGLPALPFVPIPRRPRRASTAVWKARHVAAWAGRTPFVWLEDDPEIARHLADEPGLGRHLLVRVEPRTGLTGAHLAQAAAWLAAL